MSSDGLRELSSENHNLESVKVLKILSNGLFFELESSSALRKKLNGLLESGLILLNAFGVVELFDLVFGWLDSLDADFLSLNLSVWRVDDGLLGVDEVRKNGVFLRVFSVVDINNSSFLK